MLMILARLVRSESFWAVVKVRSPHTGPGISYIIVRPQCKSCGSALSTNALSARKSAAVAGRASANAAPELPAADAAVSSIASM